MGKRKEGKRTGDNEGTKHPGEKKNGNNSETRDERMIMIFFFSVASVMYDLACHSLAAT